MPTGVWPALPLPLTTRIAMKHNLTMLQAASPPIRLRKLALLWLMIKKNSRRYPSRLLVGASSSRSLFAPSKSISTTRAPKSTVHNSAVSGGAPTCRQSNKNRSGEGATKTQTKSQDTTVQRIYWQRSIRAQLQWKTPRIEIIATSRVIDRRYLLDLV